MLVLLQPIHTQAGLKQSLNIALGAFLGRLSRHIYNNALKNVKW